MNQQRILLVGGPGSGKSTVLLELVKRGFATAEDAYRAIIQERKAQGLSPRPEPETFTRQALERDIKSYESASAPTTFFERGIPDVAGDLFGMGALSELEAKEMVVKYPYDNPAFIFPPWQDIYQRDAERDHTFEHSVSVYESTNRWYGRCGYDLVEVPHDSAENRADLILAQL